MPSSDGLIHTIGFSLDTQAPPSIGRRAAALAQRGKFYLIEVLRHLSLVGYRPEIVNAKSAAIIREEVGV